MSLTLTNKNSGFTMWNTDCITCDDQRAKIQTESGDHLSAMMRRMIVCPECGNKRCPKATHHDNPCSGSNDSGQVGSIYGGMAFIESISGDPKITF